MSALAFGSSQPHGSSATRTPEGLRVLRIMVVAVGLHRALVMTSVLAGGRGVTSVAMAVALAATGLWGGVVVYEGWRRTAFPPRLAALEVGFAVTVGLLALTWEQPELTFGYQVLQGAAIVAGCALPVAGAAVAVAALISVKLVAVLLPPQAGGITVAEFLAYAVVLAALAAAAAVASRLLRSAADALDRRRTARPDPDGVAHRRVLHDTALATLTAIARGGLDVRAEEVRARCGRDAAYLRMVVQGGPAYLPVSLADTAREAAALGLRVHQQCDTLPPDLDPAVETAMAMATREALHNVHRHADTAEAWLTAAEEDGRVVVRVVDRGAGFATPVAGSGIRDSISARMAEVGGAALVESAPGEGTYVELRWPT